MKKRVCIIGKLFYHVLLQSLRHFDNFEVVGIAEKKKKKLFQRTFAITHLGKNDQSVEPKFSVIGVPPMEQEKILNFY